MTTNCFARFAFVILLGTSVTLSGCLSRSQPSRFYLLQSSLILEETVLNQEGIKIALGPVSLPQHLDRPQIVTRVGENEFKLDEFNQWAESLSDNITLVLGRNLAVLLSTRNIVSFTDQGAEQMDYQVKVNIIRFSGVPGGNARLRTHWFIFDAGSREMLRVQISDLIQPADPDPESLVSAMSKLLEDLSREIATAIQTISQEDQP